MLRVYLFGRPRLLLDGVSLPVAARPKVIPLLAYLLLNGAWFLPRASVAASLWPDDDASAARAKLRRHLYFLNALLPPPAPGVPWVDARPVELRWNPAAQLWCDVVEFERLAFAPLGERAAIGLYGGELLANRDDEWLRTERERLCERYCETLRRAMARARDAGDDAYALEAAERLLAADPWREDAVREVMSLRFASGDRAGALMAYERFCKAIRSELDIEPMAETRALRDRIAARVPTGR